MEIKPINSNHNSIYFRGNALKKGRYALEYIDCAVQKNCPPPEVYRQYLPFQPEKAPFETLIVKSDNPTDDLKCAYDLYKKDFSIYHNYLSYKKFKNNLHYDNASVFLLRSNKETLGFYSVSIMNDNTLYICDIDMNPKYRNTKAGKDLILTCWDSITKLAETNKCEKIGLHVDANKKYLVNLYKRFGFNIIEEKTNKYRTGIKALYMEKICDQTVK